MKIHTDTLTRRDLHEAVGPIAGVYVDISDEGSASRNHGFVIHLTADLRKGRRRTNTGHRGSGTEWDYAATWDEWGMFFAHLFAVDPNLIAGDNYSGLDHYQWCTGKRFVGRNDGPDGPILNIGTHCDQHRWSGWVNLAGDRTQGCSKDCGAIKREAGKIGYAAKMDRQWTDRHYPAPVNA